MRNVILLGTALMMAACGGSSGKGAEGADDVGGPKTLLQAGTSVCISELAGVRYTIEDVLESQNLDPMPNCMGADVQVEESGQAKSWVMKYRRVGDADWKECKSTEDSRKAFATECVGLMRAELGGT